MDEEAVLLSSRNTPMRYRKRLYSFRNVCTQSNQPRIKERDNLPIQIRVRVWTCKKYLASPFYCEPSSWTRVFFSNVEAICGCDPDCNQSPDKLFRLNVCRKEAYFSTNQSRYLSCYDVEWIAQVPRTFTCRAEKKIAYDQIEWTKLEIVIFKLVPKWRPLKIKSELKVHE